MKILILTKTCESHENYGGMGQAVINHYKMLKNNGYDVYVATSYIPGKPEEFTKDGITFFHDNHKSQSYSNKFYTHTKDIVKKLRPNITIAHSGAGLGIENVKTRKIFCEHGYSYQSLLQTCQEYFLLNCMTRKIYENKLLNTAKKVWTKSREYINSFDKAVFLTKLSAMEIQQRLLCPQAVYIPPIIDEMEIKLQEKKYDVIICANSLGMGWKDLYSALNVVIPLNLRTIIVGKLDPELRAQIPANITNVGHVNHKYVYKYMRKSKILLELSYHQTGLNLVKMEGLYTGLGIIGWNVGSSYETIQEGINGYIVPLRNMDDLKEKTTSALKTYSAFSEESKKLYNKKFSQKKSSVKWNNIIKEVSNK